MSWFSRRDQQKAVPVRELSELDKSLFRASSATELESLISRGANVNADDQGRWRPLHYWVISLSEPPASPPEMLSVLLRNGANPNLRDGGGETPLDRAADWGYRSPAIVKAAALLISHGAQVDARGSNGGTALHGAANMGSAEMVQLLLRSGAEVDAWTNVSKGKVEPNFLGKIDMSGFGATPLHFAARRWHTSSAEHLLNAGADPRAKRADGLTPLQVVREQREHYRAKRPGQPDQSTYERIEQGCAEFEELLLRHLNG